MHKRPVPEHFIWHFLSQMTEALLAFQDGRCDHPRNIEPADVDTDPEGELLVAAEPWKPLLHGDIKPLNIFCAKDNRAYPSYPRVLLADFDSVQEEGQGERFVGTRDWQPPVSEELTI
jgi:serine/threonine protein kinase